MTKVYEYKLLHSKYDVLGCPVRKLRTGLGEDSRSYKLHL